MKFLIIGSFYIGTVFFILYFFSAAHYNNKPGIKQYRENIDSFYDKLKLRLSENSIKVYSIFDKDTMIASLYRHILCGKYLNNIDSLSRIGFSNEEILFYQKNICPIYSIRDIMFKELGLSILCFTLGIALMFI